MSHPALREEEESSITVTYRLAGWYPYEAYLYLKKNSGGGGGDGVGSISKVEGWAEAREGKLVRSKKPKGVASRPSQHPLLLAKGIPKSAQT